MNAMAFESTKSAIDSAKKKISTHLKSIRLPASHSKIDLAEGLDAVPQLGGPLEVETPRRVLHRGLELGHVGGEGRGTLPLGRGRLLDLDVVVVALRHRLHEAPDRAAHRLRGAATRPVV